MKLSDLRASYDRSKYHLLLVNPTAEPPYIVKIISKEAYEIEIKRLFWKSREDKKNKRFQNPEKVVKEFQITWAISPHDLEYKMKRVDEFLRKGFRVELTLAGKKGMTKVPLSQMEELVAKVKGMANVLGKEWREEEGEIGMQLSFFYQGKKKEELERDAIRNAALAAEAAAAEAAAALHAELGGGIGGDIGVLGEEKSGDGEERFGDGEEKFGNGGEERYVDDGRDPSGTGHTPLP